MIYVADFETTTDPNDCRVWGWGLYNVFTDEFNYGSDIKSFFNHIFLLKGKSKFYFHNLKFDGEFILYYLFRNNFLHTDKRANMNDKEFNTLITHMGVYFGINIMNDGKEYVIHDSLKIIPLSVEQIAKTFNMNKRKGEIDYHKKRHLEYKLTDEEINYIRNDVEIVARAIRFFQDLKLKRMTQASNAMSDFKKIVTGKYFDKLFPVLDLDSYFRNSYKGGFTYVKPSQQNKEIGEGIVLDVNSLYPSIMYQEHLPYGEPIFYEGKYEDDEIYNLYIQKIVCNFEIKKNHIPTIQIKKSMNFKPTEYVRSSNNVDVVLTLTSVDLQLFLKHYDVYNIEYIDGFKFKSSNKIFKTYIEKWNDVKEKASDEDNGGMRTLAKLMLNSLYGKFGINPLVKNKIPTYSYEEDIVSLRMGEDNERSPLYVSVAIFITSYARRVCISAAQQNYDRFIYGDTDSIHLIGKEIPNLKIDNKKIGEWKIEYTFNRARFIRAKSYIEEKDCGDVHIACAGLPRKLHEKIKFEDFKDGLVVPGKLQNKRVRGGVILKEIDFTIKL